jgi:hypothetical protein
MLPLHQSRDTRVVGQTLHTRVTSLAIHLVGDWRSTTMALSKPGGKPRTSRFCLHGETCSFGPVLGQTASSRVAAAALPGRP